MARKFIGPVAVWLVAGIGGLTVAACDDYGDHPHMAAGYDSGGWAYNGYYDGYYGNIADGYWGDDNNFYYRLNDNGGYRQGDRDHFWRGDGQPPRENFHEFHGNGQRTQGMDMPHFRGGGGDHGRDHDRH